MEITIYAIIAFFIFSRLYNAFGKSSQITKKYIEISELQAEKKVNDGMQDLTPDEEDKFKYVSSESFPEVFEVVKKIKIKEPNFSTDKFMEGAEKAFEIALSSFSNRDLKTIKPLLSKNLFESLSSKIQHYKNNGHFLNNTLISINTRELIKLQIENGIIKATVKFVSEQINTIKDKEGNVVAGNNQYEVIEDTLEFERKAGSSSPQWLLSRMY